jgi:hypothetical protein
MSSRRFYRLLADRSATTRRIAGWPIALIASEEVKGLLEDSGVSGVKYDRVD